MKKIFSAKTTETNLKPVLWIGVGLFILSIISIAIIRSMGQNFQIQDTLHTTLKTISFNTSPLIMILIGTVFIPIFEELAFRFWTIKKKYAYIVNIVFGTLFAIIITKNIIVILIVIAIQVLLFFVIKKKELPLIIVSSLIFGLLHIDGFSSINIITILSIIQIISFALILCYFALKYHFIIAVALHITNNCIAFSEDFAEQQKIYNNPEYYRSCQYKLSDSTYSFIYKPVVETPNIIEYHDGGKRIISFNGRMEDFILNISLMDTNKTIQALYTIDENTKNIMPSYNFIVVLDDTIGVNYNALLYNTLRSTGLICDTTYQATYTLKITDSSKINHHKYSETLGSLALKIQNKYNIPIFIPNNVNDNYPTNIEEETLDKCKTLEQLMVELENNNGIEMSILSNRKKMVLKFERNE
jgi:membrane protease YdiL (CAAX protease family)